MVFHSQCYRLIRSWSSSGNLSSLHFTDKGQFDKGQLLSCLKFWYLWRPKTSEDVKNKLSRIRGALKPSRAEKIQTQNNITTNTSDSAVSYSVGDFYLLLKLVLDCLNRICSKSLHIWKKSFTMIFNRTEDVYFS